MLSPAAYLVDLLQFIDLKDESVNEEINPIEQLLNRRPDIEHCGINLREYTHSVALH